MNNEIMIRAREIAANAKRWGRHPERAILSGQWDNGSIVRDCISQAERELLANRKEQED